MTTWCVDANLVLTTLLPEPTSPIAKAFWLDLAREDSVIAPLILFPECTSVLRRSVVRRILTEEQGYEAMSGMLELPIRVEDSPEQFRRAFEWATRTNRLRTHDLQYVALAQVHGATVITFDGGLEQAAIERRVPVKVLS